MDADGDARHRDGVREGLSGQPRMLLAQLLGQHGVQQRKRRLGFVFVVHELGALAFFSRTTSQEWVCFPIPECSCRKHSILSSLTECLNDLGLEDQSAIGWSPSASLIHTPPPGGEYFSRGSLSVPQTPLPEVSTSINVIVLCLCLICRGLWFAKVPLDTSPAAALPINLSLLISRVGFGYVEVWVCYCVLLLIVTQWVFVFGCSLGWAWFCWGWTMGIHSSQSSCGSEVHSLSAVTYTYELQYYSVIMINLVVCLYVMQNLLRIYKPRKACSSRMNQNGACFARKLFVRSVSACEGGTKKSSSFLPVWQLMVTTVGERWLIVRNCQLLSFPAV